MTLDYLLEAHDTCKIFYNDFDISRIFSRMTCAALKGGENCVLTRYYELHMSESACPDQTSISNKLHESIVQV